MKKIKNILKIFTIISFFNPFSSYSLIQLKPPGLVELAIEDKISKEAQLLIQYFDEWETKYEKKGDNEINIPVDEMREYIQKLLRSFDYLNSQVIEAAVSSLESTLENNISLPVEEVPDLILKLYELLNYYIEVPSDDFTAQAHQKLSAAFSIRSLASNSILNLLRKFESRLPDAVIGDLAARVARDFRDIFPEGFLEPPRTETTDEYDEILDSLGDEDSRRSFLSASMRFSVFNDICRYHSTEAIPDEAIIKIADVSVEILNFIPDNMLNLKRKVKKAIGLILDTKCEIPRSIMESTNKEIVDIISKFTGYLNTFFSRLIWEAEDEYKEMLARKAMVLMEHHDDGIASSAKGAVETLVDGNRRTQVSPGVITLCERAL